MWGDRTVEEDHHAWAHYTGVVIAEHLSKRKDGPEFLASSRDARWRNLEKERKRVADVVRTRETRDRVLATLIDLHDKIGPGTIGDAINALDRKDRRKRIHKVRYYTFKELREGLLAVVKDKKKRKTIGELLK
ncbi:MAG: hypothetical protein ACYTG4_13615 [Planctomycetota bacterium]|jgi:hypothetical protein